MRSPFTNATSPTRELRGALQPLACSIARAALSNTAARDGLNAMLVRYASARLRVWFTVKLCPPTDCLDVVPPQTSTPGALQPATVAVMIMSGIFMGSCQSGATLNRYFRPLKKALPLAPVFACAKTISQRRPT